MCATVVVLIRNYMKFNDTLNGVNGKRDGTKPESQPAKHNNDNVINQMHDLLFW